MKRKLIVALLCLASTNLISQVETSTITPQIKGSGGLSIDTAGNLYFGDFLSSGDLDGLPNSVWKLDVIQNLTEYSPGFIGASGNNFDSSGILYHSDIGSGAIYKIIGGVRTFVDQHRNITTCWTRF